MRVKFQYETLDKMTIKMRLNFIILIIIFYLIDELRQLFRMARLLLEYVIKGFRLFEGEL
ncbi:hypothetical protein J2Z42_000803 [Clostridium algifaecis]|uniref:Uncharacterized protein n=1 Tax=Clostridium algifaecis TaxID=1472040 RepID=A0ABS4KQ20_9CLOT|nr:hypothetical protein [Clostridium algifaecis]